PPHRMSGAFRATLSALLFCSPKRICECPAPRPRFPGCPPIFFCPRPTPASLARPSLDWNIQTEEQTPVTPDTADNFVGDVGDQTRTPLPKDWDKEPAPTLKKSDARTRLRILPVARRRIGRTDPCRDYSRRNGCRT